MKGQEIFAVLMTMVVLGGTFWFLPVMKGADAFFGVPVSEEFYRSDRARRLLSAYRMIVVLFCAVVAAPMAHPQWMPLMPVALSIGCIAMLGATVVLYRLVLPEEAAPPTAVVTAALTPRRPWQHVNLPLEMLSVLIVAVTAAALWLAPPTLPPSDKKGIAAMLTTQIYMFAMLLAFLPGIAQARVWLPEQDTENYLLLRGQYTRTLVGLLYFLKVALMLMFAFLGWATVLGVGRNGVLVVSGAFQIILLGGLALYVVRLYQQRKQLRALAGPGGVERSTDSRHWIGGLIYFNRDDPSLLVEKRLGIGWTFNFAHRTTWIWMALLIAAPLLIALFVGKDS